MFRGTKAGRVADQKLREAAGKPEWPELGGDLAPATMAASVVKGDERPALIQVLVTGLIGCLNEMKASDRNEDQLAAVQGRDRRQPAGSLRSAGFLTA